MRRLSPSSVCTAAELIIVIALGLLSMSSSALGQSETGGIDHVRVLVRDIVAAQNQYRSVLGFDMSRAEPNIYQEGSAHNGAAFTDGTYLELIGIADREKLLKSRPWIVDFLQDHQGAHSVGIGVTSAKDVADRLQSRGIEAPVFNLTGYRPGAKPILLVTPKLVNLPNGAIFFVEYPVQKSAQTAFVSSLTLLRVPSQFGLWSRTWKRPAKSQRRLAFIPDGCWTLGLWGRGGVSLTHIVEKSCCWKRIHPRNQRQISPVSAAKA